MVKQTPLDLYNLLPSKNVHTGSRPPDSKVDLTKAFCMFPFLVVLDDHLKHVQSRRESSERLEGLDMIL